MNHQEALMMGEPIGKQSVRQSARRAALDAQSKIRADRVEREKRLSALGVAVMVALGERDAVSNLCERRAGEALRKMTEEEALTLREAAAWCSDEMTKHEATRLRRLVDEPARAQASKDDTSEPVTRAVRAPGEPATTVGSW